ncbi:hypothetical protein AM593_02595, partial [Mytilus galloprovincialis]
MSGTIQSKSKAALSEVIGSLHRMNRLLGENSPISSIEVAFHARLKPYITLGSRQTVIFDQVITNIGKAYNQHTGHFTAPYDGIYFFACTFLRPHNATPLHLQMVKNSNEISRGHAASGGGSQTGSMNAVCYDLCSEKNLARLGLLTRHEHPITATDVEVCSRTINQCFHLESPINMVGFES